MKDSRRHHQKRKSMEIKMAGHTKLIHTPSGREFYTPEVDVESIGRQLRFYGANPYLFNCLVSDMELPPEPHMFTTLKGIAESVTSLPEVEIANRVLLHVAHTPNAKVGIFLGYHSQQERFVFDEIMQRLKPPIRTTTILYDWSPRVRTIAIGNCAIGIWFARNEESLHRLLTGVRFSMVVNWGQYSAVTHGWMWNTLRCEHLSPSQHEFMSI